VSKHKGLVDEATGIEKDDAYDSATFTSLTTIDGEIVVEDAVIDGEIRSQHLNDDWGWRIESDNQFGFFGIDDSQSGIALYYSESNSGRGLVCNFLGAIFNPEFLDYNFIIRKDQAGVEAYRYDAGLDLHNFSAVTIHKALRSTIITTIITESIDVEACTTIRQTSSGIITSLSNFTTGSCIIIKNASGGTNTLNITIEGNVSPLIYDGEGFNMVYNGTDWDLL
jgi:hypothetical protein